MNDNKTAILKFIFDDETEIGTCKCGEKALFRSYGGEVGDYCFACHAEMLKRINGISKN